VRTSKEFIVHTNHDTSPAEDSIAHGGGESGKVKHEVSAITGMDELVEESMERRACVQRKWDSLKARQEKRFREREGREEEVVSVREETLKGWIKADPVMNESTHFACILDPKMGKIRFLERGVEDDSDEEGDERFNVSD
jgi:molybdopterin biosynthesis enzyme